jgi:glycerol-3-phosphate dehydrogenase
MVTVEDNHLCRCSMVICLLKVAMADLDVATHDADVLIFVVPYQYIHTLCARLQGKVKPTAIAVSLIKVGCSVYFLTL